MKSTMAKEVLTVGGWVELIAANSSRFRRSVYAALNGHTVVEIDLSQTTSMDCAGLGALIAIRNLTRARNGVVRLLNPTWPVLQLLALARVGQIFEIVNTRSTAMGPKCEQLTFQDISMDGVSGRAVRFRSDAGQRAEAGTSGGPTMRTFSNRSRATCKNFSGTFSGTSWKA